MATQSKIEWTDCTWNPVIGCRHVAEGCRHCYAETMSKRLAAMGQRDYASILTPEGKFNGKAITRPATLAEPLHWKKPRMVFVNSMSDLFHEDVPFEFIAAVFGVMAACPQHTFQVLTKRPERALAFFEWIDAKAASDDTVANTPREFAVMQAWCHDGPENGLYCRGFNTDSKHAHGEWPLKNVWLGVSIATQADADKNIPVLLKCPAAVRFVSAEPLIGHIQLNDLRVGKDAQGDGLTVDALNDTAGFGCNLDVGYGKLDWVIVGGESGPGARPCDVAWIRSIVAQCKAAAVPVFVKQLGSNSQEQFGGSGALRQRLKAQSRKGGDPAEWPEDLRVREFPLQTVKP